MCSAVPLHDPSRRVRALTGTLTRLGIALSLAEAEREAELLLEQMEAITACVTDAQAGDFDELRAKVAVLRHRLEEHLSPDNPGEALTLALAASLMRDLDRLAA